MYLINALTLKAIILFYCIYCGSASPFVKLHSPPSPTHHHWPSRSPDPGLLEDKHHTFHEILQLQSCQHICEYDSHGNGGATVAGGPSVSRGTTQELYWQIWTEAKGPSGHRHQCMDQLPTTEAHGRFHWNILWGTISHCTMPLIIPGTTLWLSDSTPCWDNEGAWR